MFGKFVDKLLHEEEELFEDVEVKEEEEKKEERPRGKKIRDVFLSLVVFAGSLAARLYSLFYITKAQNAGVEVWYSDVYHHWQIAYLSKTVGFAQGFLRLWDLKGMEYFWGIAHPVIGSWLIGLTGSTSIVMFRVFSAVMGSLALALLYLVVKRYWGWQAGLAAAVIGALNPVGIFSDASGMVEPLGIMLMLLGIYLYPKIPVLSGVSLAIAGMARAEYWILGALVLLGILLVRDKRLGKNKIPALLGYLIPMVFYVKILLTYTGNAIYPVWWNLLGNAVGEWQADIPLTIEQMAIQKVYWVIAGVSMLGVSLTLRHRPKHTPLFLFGFGNWMMWGIVIGMTEYLKSYLPRFWVDRIMIWPYMFLGTFIAMFLFRVIPHLVPKVMRLVSKALGWGIVVVVVLVSQVAWIPINFYIDESEKHWNIFVDLAQEYSEVDSGEGKVLLPEEWPPLTYVLVHFEGLEGKRIIGQMFDPFFYMGEKPYDNWGENREVVLKWLKDEDIRLIMFMSTKERYVELVKREPEFFELLKKDTLRDMSFYKVDQDKLEAKIGSS